MRTSLPTEVPWYSPAAVARPLVIGETAQDVNVSLASQANVAAGPSGTVYLDSDGNHTLDTGEQGVANATVLLIDTKTNLVVSTATTAANGTYTLPAVLAGEPYKVVVSPPAGYQGEDGPGTSVSIGNIAPGSTTGNVNLGLTSTPTSTTATDQTSPTPASVTAGTAWR